MNRGKPFVLGRNRCPVGVPAQVEDRAWRLNKERADPALIICLITAAYEGFSDYHNQVLPYLTICCQDIPANKKRAGPWPSPPVMLFAAITVV